MRFLKAFVFLVTSICAAHSATLSLHTIEGATARVLVEGKIESGDANKLQAFVEASRTATIKVVAVSLNSPGGSLQEGYKLATVVKNSRLATEVAGENVCASACFFVFAAGSAKTASENARVGVHGAADLKGVQSDSAATATIVAARWAAKELGIPPDIIGKMVMTPPSSIIWLTNSELTSMGARIIGRTQSASAGSIPSKHGAEDEPDLSRGWPELVGSAVELSKTQNGGVVLAKRTCTSSAGVCEWSVNFRLPDGRSAALRTIQDRDGRTVSRAYCVLESSGDLRHCMDWDIRKNSEERKGADGGWAGEN